jgi:CheY-like chemotaxis protein
MLTNVIDMTTAPSELARRRDGAGEMSQKVLIVNGGDEVLDLLETVLDAGHYDVVFVESAGHAYSQVKKVRPHLIIVCLNMEEEDGFRVLSMLKMDPETRLIPLLTCAVLSTDEGDEEPEELTEDQVFAPRPVVRMN